MAELQEALRRRRQEIRPDAGAFERLVRRRVRRRRTQRAVSATVALLLAAVAAWELGQAFTRPHPRPGGLPITRKNVSRLHLAWAGGSAGAAGVAPRVSAHEVYASGFNLWAYPRSCAADTCEPMWVGNLVGGGKVTDVAVGTRLVFAASDYLEGYPQDCARQGASCSPVWVSGAHSIASGFTSVLVADGIVYAQGHMSLFAFPERCSLTCRPLWRAQTEAYGGRLVALGGGVAILQDDQALKVFRSSCRSDGGLCEPLWQTTNSSFGSHPVYSDGRVYVTRGTDEVAAFRIRCEAEDHCPPETIWKVPDATGIAVSSGRLYVTTSQSILVFDTACSTRAGCSPLWRTPDLSGNPSVPTVAEGLVFFTAGDTVYAVPEACGSGGAMCAPVWQARLPRRSGAILSSPTVTDRTVFVESTGGSLYAFEVPAG